jgi:NAD+ synthase
MRQIDYQAKIEQIVEFIRAFVKENGFSRLIVGLSGGIDSSLSATLAVKAIGKENVYGVMLPYKKSSPASLDDAQALASWLGIRSEIVEITSFADSYFDIYEPNADKLRRGNWMARSRMCVLYDLSAKYGALVVGTGNRTELEVGYCTQYGDAACAFEPIGGLYKSEVWEMSRILGIPEQIITKAPTADLWDEQTDEGELGMTYARLDELLYRLYEQDSQRTKSRK